MGMANNRMILVSFMIAAFSTFSVAHADESASNGSSSTAANSGLWSHLHANYFATFHGPNINHLDSPNTVDSNGNLSKTAMYLDSELGATYMFNDSVGVGPVMPFFLYTTRGEGFSLGDVGLKIANKKTISTSNFNLYTNLIVQLPTSDYSSNRGMTLGLKTTPNVRYVIQGTRYTVGAWTEAKAYLGATSGKLFKLYAAPYLNYQITPKFSLNVEYEMEADHFAKTNSMNFQMTQNDFMPGFVYMITPAVMVNPYLQIFTGQNITADRMALGALLSASL